LKVYAQSNIPQHGPFLITFNHYYRPGFQAWWIGLAIATTIPEEIHWIMAEAWRYPQPFIGGYLTALSRWAFHRVANVYQFTAMPPMPPHPDEVEARAKAVRQVIEYAREAPSPMIALAPVGYDFPEGEIGMPPPGAGRFIEQLSRYCKVIIPVGVFEENSGLCLRFGEGYRLLVPPGLSALERDQYTSRVVMDAIAPLIR